MQINMNSAGSKEISPLKLYNKIGYGLGDVPGSLVFTFLSSFFMIYLTDSVGLDAGISGTLIAVAKIIDALSSLFFGSVLDRTKHKMGKARPWMFYGFFGCAITLVLAFAVPMSWGELSQYIWVFITYVLLNAVFFMMNNVSYTALISLITRNQDEIVEMGSLRYICAFTSSILIQTFTITLVQAFGGGAGGWRGVAVIYAIFGLIANTISVFSVKELVDENPVIALDEGAAVIDVLEVVEAETFSPKQAKVQARAKTAQESKADIQAVLKNKYFLLTSAAFFLFDMYNDVINMGLYYMTYVLGNEGYFSVFSWFINIPLIISLFLAPRIIKRVGSLYKTNVNTFRLMLIGRVIVMIGGYSGSIALMLLGSAIGGFAYGPWQSDMGAVVTACANYTKITTGRSVIGLMHSITAFTKKIGTSVGMIIASWLLTWGGYDGTATIQSSSALQAISFNYLWLPIIIVVIFFLIMKQLKIEEALEQLRK